MTEKGSEERGLRDAVADLHQRAHAKAQKYIRSGPLYAEYHGVEVAYETVLKLIDAGSNEAEAQQTPAADALETWRVAQGPVCAKCLDETHDECIKQECFCVCQTPNIPHHIYERKINEILATIQALEQFVSPHRSESNCNCSAHRALRKSWDTLKELKMQRYGR